MLRNYWLWCAITWFGMPQFGSQVMRVRLRWCQFVRGRMGIVTPVGFWLGPLNSFRCCTLRYTS